MIGILLLAHHVPLPESTSKTNIKLKQCNDLHNDIRATYSDFIRLEMEYRLLRYQQPNQFEAYQRQLLSYLNLTNPQEENLNHQTFITLLVGTDILIRMYERTHISSYLSLAIKRGEILLGLQKTNGQFEANEYVVGAWVTPGAISTLSGLYQKTKDVRYLSAAQSAANYLINSRINELWAERENDSQISLTLWTSTGAIYALFKVFEITGEKKYFNQAISSANALISLQEASGAWKSYYDINGVPLDNRDAIQFSTTPGCILILLTAYHFTHEGKYLEAAEQAGNWLIRIQGKDGMWYPYYRGIEPQDRKISYWWDDSIIAAIDALFRIHLSLTMRVNGDIGGDNWFPAWPQDEIFTNALSARLQRGEQTTYLTSAKRGVQHLRDILLELQCVDEQHLLQVYGVNTILLTAAQFFSQQGKENSQ